MNFNLPALLIFLWASWCVLSALVDDGVIGKIIYSAIALAALGVLLSPYYGFGYPTGAEVTLNYAFAALGARHFCLKTVWPRFCEMMKKKLLCAACPERAENQ